MVIGPTFLSACPTRWRPPSRGGRITIRALCACQASWVPIRRPRSPIRNRRPWSSRFRGTDRTPGLAEWVPRPAKRCQGLRRDCLASRRGFGMRLRVAVLHRSLAGIVDVLICVVPTHREPQVLLLNGRGFLAIRLLGLFHLGLL